MLLEKQGSGASTYDQLQSPVLSNAQHPHAMALFDLHHRVEASQARGSKRLVIIAGSPEWLVAQGGEASRRIDGPERRLLQIALDTEVETNRKFVRGRTVRSACRVVIS
jgi:hypothetical protein